jgi:hypothetical protein
MDAFKELADRLLWRPMDTAPHGQRILAVVDGHVRVVMWGKTSHVPLYGFCLADQGVEDFDICEPLCWMPFPPLPFTDAIADEQNAK